MDIAKINKRINTEYCSKTYNKLTREKLQKECIKHVSFKQKIETTRKKLSQYFTNTEQMNNYLNDYEIIQSHISPGLLGNIRGKKHDKIIEKKIKSFKLSPERFTIRFEHKPPNIEIAERPDWYIYDKKTKKTIIGMNQIDIFKGGHQTNRGDKYLIDNKYNNENTKLLCVICNKTQIKNKNSKAYKFFNVGFTNDTLCYIKNIYNIINTYFN